MVFTLEIKLTYRLYTAMQLYSTQTKIVKKRNAVQDRIVLIYIYIAIAM